MQEVIVYRNPLEAAIWGALSNGMLCLNIFASLGIAVLFAYVASNLMKLFIKSKWQRSKYDGHIAIAALIVWIASMIILPKVW